MKGNLGKIKVMVSGRIAKGDLFGSKIDPCGVFSLRVKANSVLCVHCGKWIHGGCAKFKKVTPEFSRRFAC